MLSPGTGAYVSQSDKGEMVLGASLDLFPSYAQRGSFAVTQSIIAATLAIFPSFSRLRLLRQWAGIVDVVHDSSPIIGPTPVPGLYINCGWGTGGFKAIPVGGWTLAHVLATGRSHELAEPFRLERFYSGRLIDEAAGGRHRALRHAPMMQLQCPWCGMRDESEFVCAGTSHIARPPVSAHRRGLGATTSSFARTPRGSTASAGGTPTAAGSGSTSRATR